MSIYICDTETTGLTAKDQVIELATIKLQPEIHHLHSDALHESIMNPVLLENISSSQLFNPTVPIHERAKAVHGYTKRSLLGKPCSKTVKLPEDAVLIIGHNIAFDIRMLGTPQVRSICTMNLAKKIENYIKGN